MWFGAKVSFFQLDNWSIFCPYVWNSSKNKKKLRVVQTNCWWEIYHSGIFWPFQGSWRARVVALVKATRVAKMAATFGIAPPQRRFDHKTIRAKSVTRWNKQQNWQSIIQKFWNWHVQKFPQKNSIFRGMKLLHHEHFVDERSLIIL